MHLMVVRARRALSPRSWVEGMGLVDVERHTRVLAFASWYGVIGGFLLLVWLLAGFPLQTFVGPFAVLTVVGTVLLGGWGAWHRAGLERIDADAQRFYEECEGDTAEMVERALDEEGAPRLLRELVMARVYDPLFSL